MKSFTLGAFGALAVMGAFVLGQWAQPLRHGLSTSPARASYQLHEFKPKSMNGIAGVEENRLFRINETTGQTWELSTWDVPIGVKLENGKTGTQRVTGWDPISPDYNQAIQEAWREYGMPPSRSPSPARP